MNRMLQYMAYADDVVLIARNRHMLEEAFRQLNGGSAQIGLSINEGKTKYLKEAGSRTLVKDFLRLTFIVLKD